MEPDDKLIGQSLSHYKVLERLGSGGMGVVYRASDTILNRVVALKVLPPEKMADPERRRRFLQEAQAASALNHPNIVTIYEVGSADNVDYIAMEYIEGRNLLDMIGWRGLRVADTLRYALQMADALAAAHAAGIVHRDLKPSNIMVTDRGLVKVLDFGLAKMLYPREISDAATTLAVTPKTIEGAIVGTIAYMSPEQAEGKKIDHRSDVFSFGSMLYEMVTGRPPFQGETQMSTLAAIINKEPNPVSQEHKPPPELERIILRCLRKEPERRFQHMEDLKIAIQELYEESLSGRHTGLAIEPAPVHRRIRVGKWAPLFILVIGTGAAGLWWWHSRRPAAPRLAELSRLTSDSGLTAYPALSRDGKLLAYASDRGGDGNLDIWLRQIGGDQPIRLTSEEADDYEPEFSPDGTQIAFRSERDGGGIYLVSTLGGEARLIAREGRHPRFSPDGKWIAYWTGASGWVAGASKIYVVPSGGGDPKPVRPEFANARDPLWMPGGEHLLFLGRSDPKAPREKTLDWWVTPVDQGSAVKTGAFAALQGQKLVAPPGETAIAPGAWIPSGNRVVFAATLGDTTNLWQIALSAEGKAAPQADRFTFGTGVETHPSAAASPQGAQVTFSNLGLNVDVWSLPLDGNQGKVRGPLERLTQEVSFDGAPSPSADGRRLAFLSSRWGRPIVWMRDLGSGKEAALTAGRQEQFQPKVSGDGSRVVYTERESGKEIAYVVAAAGGAAEKLCEGCGIATHLSFDGTKVLLESESHPESLLLVDTRDRRRFEPIRTTPGSKLYVFAGRLSPDERWISFHTRPSPVTRQVFVAPFRGGPTVSPKEWTPITDGSAADRETYWSPDGNLLYFLSDRDRFMCIWAQRLHPQTKRPEGPAFAVQHLHSARRSFAQVGVGAIGMSVVRDRLFFALGDLTSNVWMKAELP